MGKKCYNSRNIQKQKIRIWIKQGLTSISIYDILKSDEYISSKRGRNEFMQNVTLPHNHGQDTTDLLAHMPNEDQFQIVAELFKQLCDPSRIRIFWLLCHCEECVINLSAMVGMSSPAVSHHLRQLKSNKLIVSKREGKEVYYKAANTKQAQLLHQMIEKMVEIACPGATQTVL